jgi:hypothetical protein
MKTVATIEIHLLFGEHEMQVFHNLIYALESREFQRVTYASYDKESK